MAKTKTSSNKAPLAKRGRPRSRQIYAPVKLDQFLSLLNEGFSQRAAARLARIKEHSVTSILAKPEIVVRQEELRQQKLQGIRVASAPEQALAEVGHARAELCEMAVYGEAKKPGRLRACSILLQSHGLIDAPGPKSYSAANASASVVTGSMEEIYKAKWLRDKEAAMAARFEKELSLPRQLAP